MEKEQASEDHDHDAASAQTPADTKKGKQRHFWRCDLCSYATHKDSASKMYSARRHHLKTAHWVTRSMRALRKRPSILPRKKGTTYHWVCPECDKGMKDDDSKWEIACMRNEHMKVHGWTTKQLKSDPRKGQWP